METVVDGYDDFAGKEQGKIVMGCPEKVAPRSSEGNLPLLRQGVNGGGHEADVRDWKVGFDPVCAGLVGDEDAISPSILGKAFEDVLDDGTDAGEEKHPGVDDEAWGGHVSSSAAFFGAMMAGGRPLRNHFE